MVFRIMVDGQKPLEVAATSIHVRRSEPMQPSLGVLHIHNLYAYNNGINSNNTKTTTTGTFKINYIKQQKNDLATTSNSTLFRTWKIG